VSWTALVDLIFPGSCSGCDGPAAGLICRGCAARLAGLSPVAVRPTPAPAGLPGCVALGQYDGMLRGLLLAYKERGGHPLATPLGAGLAVAVVAAVGRTDRPVAVVPIPSAPAAARERYGDHMSRMARRAVRRMRAAGVPVAYVPVLAAGAKSDSSHLDAAGRARAAADAFRVRSRQAERLAAAQRAGVAVVLTDDIVTTGATLAAAAAVLGAAGVRVDAAATVAATRRRNPATQRRSCWSSSASRNADSLASENCAAHPIEGDSSGTWA
jgi:predicted amidophosphoribosyltransferase